LRKVKLAAVQMHCNSKGYGNAGGSNKPVAQERVELVHFRYIARAERFFFD